jgi:hypothetical protein
VKHKAIMDNIMSKNELKGAIQKKYQETLDILNNDHEAKHNHFDNFYNSKKRSIEKRNN